MAWDKFETDGFEGYTGDAPLDEFAIALKKIAQKYESQFKRKPMVHELLSALSTVLQASPAQYVSDPSGVDFYSLSVTRDESVRDEVVLDVTEWEAAYTDRDDPGYYLISKCKNSDLDHIKVDDLGISGKPIRCTYEILTPGISDKMAEILIVETLFKEFLRNQYTGQIVFTNRKTQHVSKSEIPSPRIIR